MPRAGPAGRAAAGPRCRRFPNGNFRTGEWEVRRVPPASLSWQALDVAGSQTGTFELANGKSVACRRLPFWELSSRGISGLSGTGCYENSSPGPALSSPTLT